VVRIGKKIRNDMLPIWNEGQAGKKNIMIGVLCIRAMSMEFRIWQKTAAYRPPSRFHGSGTERKGQFYIVAATRHTPHARLEAATSVMTRCAF